MDVWAYSVMEVDIQLCVFPWVGIKVSRYEGMKGWWKFGRVDVWRWTCSCWCVCPTVGIKASRCESMKVWRACRGVEVDMQSLVCMPNGEHQGIEVWSMKDRGVEMWRYRVVKV